MDKATAEKIKQISDLRKSYLKDRKKIIRSATNNCISLIDKLAVELQKCFDSEDEADFEYFDSLGEDGGFCVNGTDIDYYLNKYIKMEE